MDLDRRLREGPLRIRDVWSPDKAAVLPAKVLRLRRRRSLARGGAVLVGAGLCAAAVLASGVLERAHDVRAAAITRPAVVTAPASGAASAAAASAGEPEIVWLKDGSRAEPAASDASIAVNSDRPEHVSMRLRRGAARFNVVSNPKRAFEVESGDVRVRAIGTVFTVTRTSAGERIEVEDGRVLVFWASDMAALDAGETGVFPPPPAEEPSAARPSERAHAADSAWRELARRGEYRKAYSALRGAKMRVQDRAEDHLLAADVARLSGHPEQALSHLRAVSERFAADPRAPVAAFTLGRVLSDLQRPRDAANAFHRARTLWPRGPLSLDAWASEAEAWQRAGERERAREVAARYLAQHPEGRHARGLRGLSEPGAVGE